MAEGPTSDMVPRAASAIALFASVLTAVASFTGLFTKHSLLELPPYTSDLVGGNQSADSVCGPVRQTYATEHPDFDIGVKSFEASSKNVGGPVQYQYKCFFFAKKK
jgi:hypothetical protein